MHKIFETVYTDTIEETQIVRENNIPGRYCCAELAGTCHKVFDLVQERKWHYFILIDKGELTHDGEHFPEITKVGYRSLVSISVNTKIHHLSCSANFHGYIAGVEFNTLLDIFHKDTSFPGIFRQGLRTTLSRSDIDPRKFRIIQKDFQNLMGTLGNKEHLLPEALNFSSFYILMVDLADMMWEKGHELPTAEKMNRRDSLLVSFMQAAARNIEENSSVEYYASLLCVSKSYLSQVVKQKAGVPVGVVLSTFRYERSMKYVNDPSYSLQQVADKMSFPDQATFSKFFKKHNGLSPLAYRKK